MTPGEGASKGTAMTRCKITEVGSTLELLAGQMAAAEQAYSKAAIEASDDKSAQKLFAKARQIKSLKDRVLALRHEWDAIELSPPSSVSVFWVSVGQHKDNLVTGLDRGLWGVREKYATRLNNVREGDFVLFHAKDFVLCKVMGEKFHDSVPVWPDDAYPARISISAVIKAHSEFSKVASCLRDQYGKPYRNAQACAAAVRGPGGLFRQLTKHEVECIFVKFREIMWTFVEQVRVGLEPLHHCCHGCLSLERSLG